jgi:hypothetical protein
LNFCKPVGFQGLFFIWWHVYRVAGKACWSMSLSFWFT